MMNGARDVQLLAIYSLDDGTGTVTHADFALEIPVVKCTCFQKRIADVFLHAAPAIVEKNFMALDSGSACHCFSDCYSLLKLCMMYRLHGKQDPCTFQ